MVSMRGTVKFDTKLYRAIHKSKHRFIKSFTKWRQDILLSFWI